MAQEAACVQTHWPYRHEMRGGERGAESWKGWYRGSGGWEGTALGEHSECPALKFWNSEMVQRRRGRKK